MRQLTGQNFLEYGLLRVIGLDVFAFQGAANDVPLVLLVGGQKMIGELGDWLPTRLNFNNGFAAG
jgi:hypothetical protein